MAPTAFQPKPIVRFKPAGFNDPINFDPHSDQLVPHAMTVEEAIAEMRRYVEQRDKKAARLQLAKIIRGYGIELYDGVDKYGEDETRTATLADIEEFAQDRKITVSRVVRGLHRSESYRSAMVAYLDEKHWGVC